MPSTLDCKVYVGDLGSGASKQELEEAFSYYGPLRNVWVARNPPGFAFVEFEDMRDAEDAVRGLDGRTICGRRVRVELSTGKSRSRFRGPPPRRGRPFHPDDRCYECGERGHYARDCHRYSRRYGSRQHGWDPHSQTSSSQRSALCRLWSTHSDLNLTFWPHLELHGLICKAYCLPVSQRRPLSCSPWTSQLHERSTQVKHRSYMTLPTWSNVRPSDNSLPRFMTLDRGTVSLLV